MGFVYHKNISGSDLHIPKVHASSHYDGSTDPLDWQQISGLKTYIDNQIAGENHWDNTTGTLTQHVPNTPLDLGSGSITTTGIYSGNGSLLTNLPVPSTITVTDESTDTTCYPLFATDRLGNLTPHTGTNFLFDSDNGHLTVTGNVAGGNVTSGDNPGHTHSSLYVPYTGANATVDLGTNDLTTTGTVTTGNINSSGSIILPIATKTSNYSITNTDYTILADGSSNAVVIGIPSAVGIEGRIYNIKCINDTFQCETDLEESGETLDGDSSNFVLIKHETITIQSDGSNWWII